MRSVLAGTVRLPWLAVVLLATSLPAGLAAGDVNRMTLAGGRVSLEAPVELALAVTQEQLLVEASPPPCDPGFTYCFYLPEEAYAGTNLRSAGLAITRRQDLRAMTSCLLAQPAGWTELQPDVRMGEELDTSRFGDVGQGSAGSFTRGDVLRLFDGEECWELETRLGLTRFENYAPGTVEEFTSEDEAAVLELIWSVLDSTSVDGAAVRWPAGGSSALEDFVRVDLPDQVTSPMVLRGEARGTWFFEGSFAVSLMAPDGSLIASGLVTATDEWMTEGFVPFEGTLEFEVAGPTPAILVLERDNPSGLPEHDAAVRLEVELR
ncbi:MAG TPA: Gmad2 immunoglobulin-like domain-containing protein [Trueperaceae bacterium]|nr:Gmad2 immunoglobulin-like domain-containing protein [Trueperaceae bacterium]